MFPVRRPTGTTVAAVLVALAVSLVMSTSAFAGKTSLGVSLADPVNADYDGTAFTCTYHVNYTVSGLKGSPSKRWYVWVTESGTDATDIFNPVAQGPVTVDAGTVGKTANGVQQTYLDTIPVLFLDTTWTVYLTATHDSSAAHVATSNSVFHSGTCAG